MATLSKFLQFQQEFTLKEANSFHIREQERRREAALEVELLRALTHNQSLNAMGSSPIQTMWVVYPRYSDLPSNQTGSPRIDYNNLEGQNKPKANQKETGSHQNNWWFPS